MSVDNFYKKKLKNGLTVLFEERKLPIISTSASIKFGAQYESLRLKGIAHLMEHLMFKQSKTRTSEELAKEVEKKGGDLNAFTDEGLTCYWNKLPSKYFSTGLDISSDLILNPKFDPVDFEKEKKVVIEEIKMYNDSPRMYATEKFKEMLYKKPFGDFIAGSVESVSKLSLNQVHEIYNNYYATNKMILCCVGKGNFKDICEFGKKIFPARIQKKVDYNPIKLNSEKIEKRKGVDQANFIFGYHTVPLFDKRRYLHDVIGAYLWDGMSSRFFNEIREKRGLAYAVKGGVEMGIKHGYAMIYVGTVAEKIKLIKELILKEFRALKNMEKKDFDEAKEQLIGQHEIGVEDSNDVMLSLLNEELGGNALEHYNYEERIGKVQFKELKEFKLKRYSSFALIPEK